MSAFRGAIGELSVHASLKLFLKSKDYHLFRDVIVPYPGGTSQIDNLIVSRFGIFVIEVKNYKGWIFGDPNQKMWTQVIYKKRYQFFNPLRQNYGHIRALKDYLILSVEEFHSIVYFVGSSICKTPMPDNVLQNGVIPYIKKFRNESLTKEELLNTMVMLNGLKGRKDLTKENHVASLKKGAQLQN